MWQLLTGLIPGGKTLSQGIAVLSLIATLLGGAGWLYSAIKAQGKAEAQLEQVNAAYATLERETGEAILTLNQQRARERLAAAQRQRDDAQIAAQTAATITDLKRELDDARESGNTCLDVPLPPGRAERVRQLAEAAGHPGGD